MEFQGEIQSATVTQKQMSKALGLSTTRINQLVDEGILVRDEMSRGRVMLFESLQNYFLSKQSAGSDGANFWKERSLHERAKRELAELKVAERRGELYEAATVESVLSELITNFKNNLQGIGHKLALQLSHKTPAQAVELIDGEINNLLQELSENAKSATFTADIEGGNASDDTADGQRLV